MGAVVGEGAGFDHVIGAVGGIAQAQLHGGTAALAVGCALILDTVEVLEEHAEVILGQRLAVVGRVHGGELLLVAVVVGLGLGRGGDGEGVAPAAGGDGDLADGGELHADDHLGHEGFDARFRPADGGELDGVDDVFIGAVEVDETVLARCGGVEGDGAVVVLRLDGGVGLAQTVVGELLLGRIHADDFLGVQIADVARDIGGLDRVGGGLHRCGHQIGGVDGFIRVRDEGDRLGEMGAGDRQGGEAGAGFPGGFVDRLADQVGQAVEEGVDRVVSREEHAVAAAEGDIGARVRGGFVTDADSRGGVVAQVDLDGRAGMVETEVRRVAVHGDDLLEGDGRSVVGDLVRRA